MRSVPGFLLRSMLVAALPATANAAGTYYNTGSYQSPQTARYGAATSGGYSQYSTYNRTRTTGPVNTGSYASRYGYNAPAARTTNAAPQAQQQQSQRAPNSAATSAGNGFFVNADIAREYAMWQFDMNESGSSLHYDNVSWNVFSLNGGYVFDAGNTKVQIDAGLKYGIQGADSTMIDDDISNGGYLVTQWVDTAGNTIGDQIGHAMSIGTTSGGNMLGLNFGVGLPGIFNWGSVKMTPSVGYRYLKYKLETSKNYGLAIDTARCFITENGETQCDPLIIFRDEAGNESIYWRKSLDEYPSVPGGSVDYDTAGTYYFQQPGVSHSYEVEWSGPYIAMDAEYQINQNNAVTGRLELGFPGYTATGDQPYRFDWQHPKSVEDKSGMFSALHLGLGANWMTALTDTISLLIGVTYDYYTVSGADATTYLNGSFYTNIYNEHLADWKDKHSGSEDGFLDAKTGDQTAIAIKNLEADCPGWVCKVGSEVDSFYRSLGVHIGINAKF